MPEGEDVDGILGLHVAIKRDVAGIAKADDQLSQLQLIRDGAANVGVRLQERELVLYGLAGTQGCIAILACKEATTPFQAAPGTGGNDYPWHSGSSVSSSLPHLFSQSRTSSPVRCSPVS